MGILYFDLHLVEDNIRRSVAGFLLTRERLCYDGFPPHDQPWAKLVRGPESGLVALPCFWEIPAFQEVTQERS